jgi:hypothetical protein
MVEAAPILNRDSSYPPEITRSKSSTNRKRERSEHAAAPFGPVETEACRDADTYVTRTTPSLSFIRPFPTTPLTDATANRQLSYLAVDWQTACFLSNCIGGDPLMWS